MEIADQEHVNALLASRDLAGPDWREAGTWKGITPPQPPPEAVPGQGRRPRTKEELAAAAADLGIPPAKPAPEAETVPEAPVELSLDNSKAELTAAAERLGIELPKWANKAKILELITAQAGE